MLILDKYFYGLIDDINTAVPPDSNKKRDDGDHHVTSSLSQLVDTDYLFAAMAAPDPDTDDGNDAAATLNGTSSQSLSPSMKSGDALNGHLLRPFFILLWRNGDDRLTLYLVSKESPSILIPVLHLLMPTECALSGDGVDDAVSWSVVSNDNRSVYVGTAQCWLFGCF